MKTPRTGSLLERCCLAMVAALALVAAGVVDAADARAQIVQLTANDADCELFAPSSNSDGTLVALESTCDLVGSNADGNREIFQVDAAGTVTQLTDSNGCSNASPSSNAAGDRVAFDSDCDYIDENSDGSFEIFMAIAGVVDQLTDGTICSSFSPSINAAGDRVSFDSDCDFLLTNSDASAEIFQVTDSGAIAQLTAENSGSGCTSLDASSSASGELVAFESDCDLTGENFDQVSEIFQVSSGGFVTQLTVSPLDTCLSSAPSSDTAGTLIAFESDCDYAAANADASVEIFRVSSAGVVEQLTDDDGSSGCESSAPAISADGAGVWYTGSCDPAATNSDGSQEIFLVRGASVEQVTDAALGCSSFAPAASGGSKRGVFASSCDLTGANGTGNDQVFSVSLCFCGAPASRFAASSNPVATDALFALNAAVALVVCDLCDCDVNSSGNVAASDALAILQAATGQGVVLDCP